MKIRFLKSLCIFVSAFALLLNISSTKICAGNNVFYSNAEKTKKIALTFDDGPHPRYTKQILEILQEYNVTATFFIIGVNAINYPDTLLAIAASGCEIANHTFTHKNVLKMSSEEITKEIEDCRDTVYQISGIRTTLFRPPEGACAEAIITGAKNLEHKIILWSIDTKDWAHTPSSQIAEKVIGCARDGDIVLMHDYVSGNNTTIDALRMMIPQLIEKGYEFVTISELLG
jgi:peptidoglycan/xylan/chitin deacetylase (PgdA/CDA1 family)